MVETPQLNNSVEEQGNGESKLKEENTVPHGSSSRLGQESSGSNKTAMVHPVPETGLISLRRSSKISLLLDSLQPWNRFLMMSKHPQSFRLIERSLALTFFGSSN